MKKVLYISLGLIAAGTFMWAWYAVEGSYVDESGFLQEPFYLLATGWLLNGAGALGLLYCLAMLIKYYRST